MIDCSSPQWNNDDKENNVDKGIQRSRPRKIFHIIEILQKPLRFDKPHLEKGNIILTFADTQTTGLEKHRKEAMVCKTRITHL